MKPRAWTSVKKKDNVYSSKKRSTQPALKGTVQPNIKSPKNILQQNSIAAFFDMTEVDEDLF